MNCYNLCDFFKKYDMLIEYISKFFKIFGNISHDKIWDLSRPNTLIKNGIMSVFGCVTFW